MNKRKFILNFIYLTCLGIVAYLCYKYLLPVLMPFIIGLAIAMVAHSLVKKANTKVSRILVLSIGYIVFAVVVILLGANLIEMIARIDYQTLFTEKLIPWVNEIYESALVLVRSLPKANQEALRDFMAILLEEAQSLLLGLSGKFVSFAAGLISSIPSLFLSTLVAIIASFYVAVDYDVVMKGIRSCIPKPIYELGHDLVVFTKERLGRFVVNYLKLMLINFIECTIGFMVLGIEGAVPLAILTSVVDVLPILGTGTVLIPWGIVAFFTNKIRGLGLIALYIIITVIRNVIEPKFVGTSINLHPLLTFVCMIVGLHFMGILGLFVFPLIASFILYMKETKPEIIQAIFD